MLKYIKGDATEPQGEGVKLVIHIVNDIGRFGSGFAKAIKDRYPIVRNKYIEWFRNQHNFVLGQNQFVKVTDELWFCNMIAQHGIIGKHNPTPIRYDALRKCLQEVCLFCKRMNTEDNATLPITKWSVFGPRFGSKLAGGDWQKIEKIISEELINNGIDITIYEL